MPPVLRLVSVWHEQPDGELLCYVKRDHGQTTGPRHERLAALMKITNLTNGYC